MSNESQILLYRAEDGNAQIQVKLRDETVWLTQAQMAELFQKDVRTINEHLQNLFEESELEREATIRKFRIVQTEGKRQVTREVDFYNLDVIISVGYRVKSHRGTQFRIRKWKRRCAPSWRSIAGESRRSGSERRNNTKRIPSKSRS